MSRAPGHGGLHVVVQPKPIRTLRLKLDPDGSPRVSAPLRASQKAVKEFVATGRPFLGFIGQPHVNVLAVNRALDGLYPLGHSKAP